MERDSKKDPATYPNASLAKVLVNQVVHPRADSHYVPSFVIMGKLLFRKGVSFSLFLKIEAPKAFRWTGSW